MYLLGQLHVYCTCTCVIMCYFEMLIAILRSNVHVYNYFELFYSPMSYFVLLYKVFILSVNTVYSITNILDSILDQYYTL